MRLAKAKSIGVLKGLAGKTRTVLSRVAAIANYFQKHPEVLRGYALHARKLGLLHSLRRVIEIVKRGGPRQSPVPNATCKPYLRSPSGQPTVILTTLHCLYIAKAIAANLSRVGIASRIIHEQPVHGYGDCVHVVICPHMFVQLPDFYIAFQMEQSVSSRWFTDEYVRILENSVAILDYSTANISFLKLKGLSPRQIYYLPIGYIDDYGSPPSDTPEDYDVVFYGDVKNDRRKKFLHELKKHFRVKVINNLFGAPLHSSLVRARVVVNIHYYAGALLETTRIWECLSLHKFVISERSSDMDQHGDLMQLIDFVDIDDIEGMVERVRFWLQNDELRRHRISENRALLKQQPNRFDYFFYRFLLATDNITFEEFWQQAGRETKLPSDLICLSLPEYIERTAEFNKDNHFGFSCFPGLRHSQSWLGCAMSYKLIIMLARQQFLSKITICEDDVEFPADFKVRWEHTCDHLNDEGLSWHIFSGLMSDLDKDVHILETHTYQGQQFATIDKLISTVFNVYHKRVFDIVVNWDQNNHDITTNTIDRYLEHNGFIRVLITEPFLVGHKEAQQSTIWDVENSHYTNRILASNQLLKEKIRAYTANARPS